MRRTCLAGSTVTSVQSVYEARRVVIQVLACVPNSWEPSLQTLRLFAVSRAEMWRSFLTRDDDVRGEHWEFVQRTGDPPI